VRVERVEGSGAVPRADDPEMLWKERLRLGFDMQRSRDGSV
jgi:hypothetical protein